ncbi:MAG: sensor domain-containing diguanylate cyclase [Lachnospiraceae bacterium]
MELVSKSLPGGIMGGYLEAGFPLYTINDRMLEILGYTYEELAAATDEKMMNIIYEEDQKRVEESISQQFLNGNEYEIEYRIVGKDGNSPGSTTLEKKIVTEDGREAMISIMTDISDRRAREKQLIQEAYYDPLTGLYNRKKAISLYKEAFANGQKGTFFICDIDNFKSLNDTEGHIAGDHVLIFLARLISDRTKEFAISARLGGDEYMLFFPSPTETEEAVHLMKSIQTTFAAATKEAYPELSISLSVGGVCKENEDFRSLYRQADTALYLAKHQKGSLQI